MGTGKRCDMPMTCFHLGHSKPIVQPQVAGLNSLGPFCHTGLSTQVF